MIALVDALVRHTPPAVKVRLRGNGKRRRPGRPLLVATRPYEGRHRIPTVWDDLNDLDPSEWQRRTAE